MKAYRFLIFLVVATSWSFSAASATTLLLGNYPPSNDGTFSTIAATTGNFSKAAGFTLPAGSDYTLDSVVVRLNVSDTSSTVSFSLFGDIGGNPGGAPLIALSMPSLNSGIGNYTLIPATGFVLQNLATYWITATGTSSTADGVTWLASNPGVLPTGIATSAGYRSDSSGVYPPTRLSTIDNTYQVFATVVPEPSTMAAICLAAAGLATMRRCRAP